MEFNQDVMVWTCIGILLIASELFTGTFHLLFFGLAGLLTALFVALGLQGLWQEVTVFGALSLLAFFIVQKKFVNQSRGKSFEADVHQVLHLSDSIPANGEGTVQYQGSPWTAVNTEDIDLLKGNKAVIVKTEGVKLFLKANR